MLMLYLHCISSSLNGNNGSWTNSDDVDQQGGPRTHKEKYVFGKPCTDKTLSCADEHYHKKIGNKKKDGAERRLAKKTSMKKYLSLPNLEDKPCANPRICIANYLLNPDKVMPAHYHLCTSCTDVSCAACGGLPRVQFCVESQKAQSVPSRSRPTAKTHLEQRDARYNESFNKRNNVVYTSKAADDVASMGLTDSMPEPVLRTSRIHDEQQYESLTLSAGTDLDNESDSVVSDDPTLSALVNPDNRSDSNTQYITVQERATTPCLFSGVLVRNGECRDSECSSVTIRNLPVTLMEFDRKVARISFDNAICPLKLRPWREAYWSVSGSLTCSLSGAVKVILDEHQLLPSGISGLLTYVEPEEVVKSEPCADVCILEPPQHDSFTQPARVDFKFSGARRDPETLKRLRSKYSLFGDRTGRSLCATTSGRPVFGDHTGALSSINVASKGGVSEAFISRREVRIKESVQGPVGGTPTIGHGEMRYGASYTDELSFMRKFTEYNAIRNIPNGGVGDCALLSLIDCIDGFSASPNKKDEFLEVFVREYNLFIMDTQRLAHADSVELRVGFPEFFRQEQSRNLLRKVTGLSQHLDPDFMFDEDLWLSVEDMCCVIWMLRLDISVGVVVRRNIIGYCVVFINNISGFALDVDMQTNVSANTSWSSSGKAIVMLLNRHFEAYEHYTRTISDKLKELRWYTAGAECEPKVGDEFVFERGEHRLVEAVRCVRIGVADRFTDESRVTLFRSIRNLVRFVCMREVMPGQYEENAIREDMTYEPRTWVNLITLGAFSRRRDGSRVSDQDWMEMYDLQINAGMYRFSQEVIIFPYLLERLITACYNTAVFDMSDLAEPKTFASIIRQARGFVQQCDRELADRFGLPVSFYQCSRNATLTDNTIRAAIVHTFRSAKRLITSIPLRSKMVYINNSLRLIKPASWGRNVYAARNSREEGHDGLVINMTGGLRSAPSCNVDLNLSQVGGVFGDWAFGEPSSVTVNLNNQFTDVSQIDVIHHVPTIYNGVHHYERKIYMSPVIMRKEERFVGNRRFRSRHRDVNGDLYLPAIKHHTHQDDFNDGRTLGPLVMAHSGHVLANSPENLTQALRRHLQCRGNNPEFDEMLRINQERWTEANHDRLEREFFGVENEQLDWYNLWDDPRGECDVLYVLKHPKLSLRRRQIEQIRRLSKEDCVEWNEEPRHYCVFKLKLREVAKYGKYGRIIVDLGVARSLQSALWCAFNKEQIAYCRKIGRNSMYVFCKEPSEEYLTFLFEWLDTHTFDLLFINFSDDTIYSVYTPDGRRSVFLLDIEKNDASITDAHFIDYLKFWNCPPKTMERILNQARLPIRVDHPDRDKRANAPVWCRISVFMTAVFLYLQSGGGWTTALNCFSSSKGFAEMAWCGEDLHDEEVVRLAWSRVGFLVTIEKCYKREDYQFLKMSPVLCSDGRHHAVLNLGPLFRAYGYYKGQCTWCLEDEKIYSNAVLFGMAGKYRCDLYDILYHDLGFSGLFRRRSIVQDKAASDYELRVQQQEILTFSVDSLLARYSEYEGLSMYNEFKEFVLAAKKCTRAIVCCELVDLVMRKDYGFVKSNRDFESVGNLLDYKKLLVVGEDGESYVDREVTDQTTFLVNR